MSIKAIVITILVLLVVVLVNASFFTLTEGEQAVVTQFGDPVRVVTEAGLRFKMPFIQVVNILEKRSLPWDGDAQLMPTADKKRIFVDVWARWRITDPRTYFMKIRTEQGGYKILADQIDSAVRNVVSGQNLVEVVRTSNRRLLYDSEEYAVDQAEREEKVVVGRPKMEEQMKAAVTAALEEGNYGIGLVDLRIKRVSYSDAVRNSVIERMKSERDRIAKLYESEALEEQSRILGQTRREIDEIEGEREQRSAEIRGEADAEVIRIYAEALGQDPEFFDFMRRLEAYRNTLGSRTRLILSTDNDIMRLLRDRGRPAAGPQ